MEDKQIIQLYFDRSESAIEETARKFGAYLNQIAYHILRNREDTEEVVSDTYNAAWNTIPPTVPKALKHFLSRIARNLAFDRMDYLTAGRRSSHMSILLSELEGCLPDNRSNMEQIWEAKEIAQILNQFLGTLDHTDCRIFLNRYYYGLTITEIARKYGLSESKIKYRLGCLRRKLRTMLEKEGIPV